MVLDLFEKQFNLGMLIVRHKPAVTQQFSMFDPTYHQSIKLSRELKHQ